MISFIACNFSSLFILNMNGSSFISDEAIAFFFTGLILIHVFSLAAWYGRVNWLRYICAVLYIPVFLLTLLLASFDFSFIVLVMIAILFYYFIIIRARKA